MVEIFNPSEPLPPELLVTSAGSHLYRIGLSHFPFGWKRRKKIHYPLLIALLNAIILVKSITSLLLTEENPELFILLFDFSFFLNARIHYNICVTVIMILTLISQILHYVDYKKGLKPSYLKPFEMMLGLVSSQSIGLTNKVKIYKLVKLSKQLFLFCDFICEKVVPIFSLMTSTLPMIKVCSLKQMVFYIIPMNIVYAFGCYTSYNIILYQMVYFFQNTIIIITVKVLIILKLLSKRKIDLIYFKQLVSNNTTKKL